MKAVIQRVTSASVEVGGSITGQIDNGFLVLLGVTHEDEQTQAAFLAKKISEMRIFTDENDKMNLSLKQVGGSVLAVSQFTLYADCSHGRRPSFINAAKADKANELYEYFCRCLNDNGIENVQTGIFGADMKVSLLNDGPVTIVLDTDELK